MEQEHLIADDQEFVLHGPADGARWVVVLADGGPPRGGGAPRAFRRLADGRTALGAMLDLAGRLAPPERQVVAVLERHREWWAQEIPRLRARSLLVQPSSRGSAVPLLIATLRVLANDPAAQLVVLPGDAEVGDAATLEGALRAASLDSVAHDGRPVLLGMVPERTGREHPWVMPAAGLERSTPVARFVERPSSSRASFLLEHGGLWTSTVVVAEAAEMLSCFRRRAEGLLQSVAGLVREHGLDAFFPAAGDVPSPDGNERFGDLPRLDFRRAILEKCANRLRVLPVPPCGWAEPRARREGTRAMQGGRREVLRHGRPRGRLITADRHGDCSRIVR